MVSPAEYTEEDEERFENYPISLYFHVDCDGQEDWYLDHSRTDHTRLGHKCDKYYDRPSNGHCESEDDKICTPRNGKWKGHKICLAKKFQCDNHVQCEDGSDEDNCETVYLEKKLLSKDEDYVCKSPFLVTRNSRNESGKFFPIRAVR